MNSMPQDVIQYLLLNYTDYNEIYNYSLVSKEWRKILKNLLREIYVLLNSFALDLFNLVLLEKVDMIIYNSRNKLLDYYDIRKKTDMECNEKVVQEFINDACVKLLYYVLKHKMFQILCYTSDRNQNIENYKNVCKEFNNMQKINMHSKKLIYLNKRKKIRCNSYKRMTGSNEMCIIINR